MSPVSRQILNSLGNFMDLPLCTFFFLSREKIEKWRDIRDTHNAPPLIGGMEQF
jgi:hypothetical protein